MSVRKPGPVFTHIGTRYRFGYSIEPPSYGIWDNDHPGPPVERFPYTDHEKDEALDRFRTLEPEASDVRRKPETGQAFLRLTAGTHRSLPSR